MKTNLSKKAADRRTVDTIRKSNQSYSQSTAYARSSYGKKEPKDNFEVIKGFGNLY